MFWDTTYTNSANIDALLSKDDCSLKELLDEVELLQECKSQNQKIVKFLNRPEVVDELVTLITIVPPSNLDEKQRFLHPNLACEILTCDIPSLKQRIAEDHNLLNKLYGFFEQKTQLNPLLASFICKTFGMFIVKKMDQDWFLYQTICLYVLEFIKTKDNFLDVMVHHFSTPVVMDLLLTMLNDIEDPRMKSSFLEWINERGLIEKMIDVLHMPNENEKHVIVAQFLTELIKTGRCNRQNDTEDRKSLPNPLLHRLENSQTTTRLIDAILSATSTESGILSGLQVLLCLLENSIIQEPVSQTALQQIIDAEKEHHDEVVNSLMSIIQPRIHQLFELLLNPPLKTPLEGVEKPMASTLGNVRLQLCNLFTVLLETENSLIIEEICKTNFFTELLNLFKQYCWNNFLHNYVRRCFVYGVQAFDTIPNNTQLVISALQKHIIVDCKLADRLIDCWNENALSQQKGGRRLGYMGHLIEILSAISSTESASDDFRALLESSLTCATLGSGEPISAIDVWTKIMQSNENELQVQKRFLADCDPSERQEYGQSGLTGFPSIPDDTEIDTEDYSYNFIPSMHSAVNGNDFNTDYNDDDDLLESRHKMFEEACNQNTSAMSFHTNFDNWDQHQFFNSALLKSSPFEEQDDNNKDSDLHNDPFTNDPFADTSTSGFDAIIDNFADFDSHFANMAPIGVESMPQMRLGTEESYEAGPNDDKEQQQIEEQQCFVATTQVIEISSLPPPETTTASMPDFLEMPEERHEFQLGPNPVDSDLTSMKSISAAIEELEDEEFYSLRDDSNEMNSFTDDTDRKLVNENTEIPEDDDDDFASADESSSKGNSEEETNSNAGDHFVDCTLPSSMDEEEHSKTNGIEKVKESEIFCESDDEKTLTSDEFIDSPDIIKKLAQSPEEAITNLSPTTVVPLENGSA
ncbi:hypothetical protein ACKWTF_003426 [Chironomus riparius]